MASLTTVSSLSYLFRTPTEEVCGLTELEISAIQRREEKKRRQREAAQTLRSGESLFLFDDGSLPSENRFTMRRESYVLPVLSPTTFALETFDATEWISVHRRKRRSQMERRARHRSSPEKFEQQGGPR